MRNATCARTETSKWPFYMDLYSMTEVKSGGSLAWAIMARSLFSRLGTACLLYLYVINVIYLVPNIVVKKKLILIRNKIETFIFRSAV
jgi:hypothetical protein